MDLNNYNTKRFIRICEESLSMSQACSKLGLHFNTFKRIAKKLKCYYPNKKGLGINKNKKSIKTVDILNGKYPSYQTYKLKRRLLKEGIKTNICEICGQDGKWNNKPLNMELEHKDGKRNNHSLENLAMICPNCHSQTETYRSKNKKQKTKNKKHQKLLDKIQRK